MKNGCCKFIYSVDLSDGTRWSEKMSPAVRNVRTPDRWMYKYIIISFVLTGKWFCHRCAQSCCEPQIVWVRVRVESRDIINFASIYFFKPQPTCYNVIFSVVHRRLQVTQKTRKNIILLSSTKIITDSSSVRRDSFAFTRCRGWCHHRMMNKFSGGMSLTLICVCVLCNGSICLKWVRFFFGLHIFVGVGYSRRRWPHCVASTGNSPVIFRTANDCKYIYIYISGTVCDAIFVLLKKT